jgi:predicted Zn-dependent protease
MLPWTLPLHTRALKLFCADNDFLKPLALQALHTWLQVLPHTLAPQLVGVPGQSDIVVQWITPLPRYPYAVGLTQRTPQFGPGLRLAVHVVQHAAIDATQPPQHYRQRVLTTLLHEMGHALGLDHCPDTHAVMHARGWQQHQLTATDKHLLQARYANRHALILKT